MKKKTIRSASENGRTVYYVTLGNSGKEAVIFKEDWDEMRDLGLTANWNLHALGYVSAPSVYASGRHIQVARVLLDAGRGEGCRYADGDKLNLRRENVYKVEDRKAIRRDRELLKAKPVRVDPEIVEEINA